MATCTLERAPGASPAGVVPVWGAKLMYRLKKQGYSHQDIADIVGYAKLTVRHILRFRREHGIDREPRSGKGKKSDPRWVFAGAWRHAALAELERVKQMGDDADLLKEVHEVFLQRGFAAPAYRTLCRALQEHLEYTCKRVRLAAPARITEHSPALDQHIICTGSGRMWGAAHSSPTVSRVRSQTMAAA